MRCARWGAAVISRTVDVRFPADLAVPDGLGSKLGMWPEKGDAAKWSKFGVGHPITTLDFG